ncbi:MAG: VWA domain-containing protein [Candidatus Woesearchaeota archaeon]
MSVKKRGELAINVVFSIVITILAIALMLSLGAQMRSGKEFYCKLAHKYVPRFYNTRMDSFCAGVGPHDVKIIKAEQIISSEFSDGSSTKILGFSNSRLERTFQITVDRDAILQNASIVIGAPHNIVLRTFASGETNITLPPYPLRGGTNTALIKIPKYAIIKNASIELYGSNYPTKTDIAFAIDISGSMTNEWSAVCSIVSNISKILSAMHIEEYRVRVYAIGVGDPCGKTNVAKNCPIPAKNLKITYDQLRETGLPMNTCQFSFSSAGCSYSTIGLDQPSEAWGVASYYLSSQIEGEDAWLSDAKRIEILISDSDPNGAVYQSVVFSPCSNDAPPKYPTPVSMSGNEEEVIDRAIQKAQQNNIFVNVVYGDDDSTTPEGFSIGSGPGCYDGCCPSHPYSCINVQAPNCNEVVINNCRQIISMMKRLASSTGGKIFGFRDEAALAEAVKQMVISNYPNQIGLSISGVQFAYRQDELNNVNSPWKVSGQGFVNSLQRALSECSPDEEGNCIIPLEVSSGRDGTISISHLKIVYDIKAEGVTLSIEGKDVMTATNLNAESKTVSLTDEIKELEKSCSSDYCTFTFKISTAGPTQLIADDLKLSYTKYPVKEEIVSAIADCWRKSRYGQEKTSFFCSELGVPREYNFIRAVTERDIAKILMDRQWCHIIGDSEYGCGDSDNINFTKDINTNTNILVEYDSTKRQVVVT